MLLLVSVSVLFFIIQAKLSQGTAFPTRLHVCLAKNHISLRIRAVYAGRTRNLIGNAMSVSSLNAYETITDALTKSDHSSLRKHAYSNI